MSAEYKLCACPLDCLDVCSMRAEIINDKITKLEGNKDHPITKGFICEKGKKHIERMYSPLRIKKPMKKVQGEFVEINWDEAIDIIAGKLKAYINMHGSLSIAQYNDGGAGGLLKGVENLFFDYLGAVTLFEGSLCWGAGIAAQRNDFGDVRGHYPEDVLNSKVIVIWGKNPAHTNMHLMPYLKQAKENGAKIILIDPIKTATAAFSDWHIQLKPDGDTAFALATAKYMIEKQLYDVDFVSKHCNGFDEIKQYVSSVSYEELCEISGAAETAVCSFAELLCNKPATIYIGYGIQRYLYGGTTIRAIDMLGALAGIIGIPGGGVNYANRVYSDYISWDKVKPAVEPQHRYITKPKLAVELGEQKDPGVKAIFISRSNPAVQLPNTQAAVKTISDIEFKVVLDYFMTDTAKLADIVLPVTYFMEETDIIYSSMWNGYIFYNEKLVSRYYEARPEFEIYSVLAEKLGMRNFPQLTETQWIDKLLQGTKKLGLDIEELKTKSYSRAMGIKTIPWMDNKFLTPSGQFEFVKSQELKSALSKADKLQQDEFQLITVHAKESLHSQHMMTSTVEHPEFFISRTDAWNLGIQDKELVKLQNQYGSMLANASISENCKEGVLYMKEGWWFKHGGSVNNLTSHEVSDIGNQAVYNECHCKISRIGAQNE